jgi:PAS domain S-box-containing protein
MIRTRLQLAAHWAAFAVLLLAAAMLHERGSPAVNQAIIWLPTGVGIAGVWLLGPRAAWVVFACTFVQRLIFGYDGRVAVPAAAGSTAEAMLGVFVLRRLGFDAAIARLRDVAALLAAAAVAPLASILFSWIGRTFLWANPNMPFYSGWDGWWRMNALGALTLVPVALTWLTIPRRELGPGLALGAVLAVIGVPTLLGVTMVAVPPGITGVMWLNLVLMPVVIYAGGRHGIRGATLVGTLSALVVAAITTNGFGPFLELPREQRHVALQLFELTFVVVPPAFGALLAERRAAQAQGARSDELRRSIQAALPDITYRVRRDGACLEVSVPPGLDQPRPLIELESRTLVGQLARQRERASVSAMESGAEPGGPSTLEYELELDGRRCAREARCVPYGPDETLAVVRDITERKWSEGTMALEARVLERVATGRPPAEVFEAIVRGIERLTPGARCSIIVLEGRRMHVAMAPSLPDSFNASVERLEVGPMVGSCGTAAWTGRTTVVRDIATDPLWVPYRDAALPLGLRACWSVPIRDSAGIVVGTFAVYYGEPRAPEPRELALAERAGALAGVVLEREHRSDALRRSEELLASINRNVSEGLFRASADLRLVYANLALARMFGFEAPADVIGRPLREAFAEPERAHELEQVVRSSGQCVQEEVRFVRADGSTFWGLVSSIAVRGPGGDIAHHDGAIADITARKALEEQFRQAQKMEAVGKLAGGVAHDFNNLLTVILGHAEAIRGESDRDGALRAHAERVLEAARRASGLTRQLLAYSRQQVLSPRVLELNAVVDQMSGMLRRLIGEDVRLLVEHRSGPCWVRVDPSQMEQVLLNLVVNARDAMPSGGTATIVTMREPGPDGTRVVLGVHDTGVGMSPEVQARAFDPFYTTKPPGQGTGLGLSTVHGIVLQSGGAVWLESVPGAGTTVWVSLPAGAPPEATGPEIAPAPRGRSEGTVLVVEDESAVRGLVCRMLEGAGFRVIEAGDGAMGLDAARSHAGRLDLVVTDVVMPRVGGREMAAEILALRPGTRFLFISGYAEDARAADDLAGGAGAFLAKPFSPEQLVERVRSLVGSAPASTAEA